MKAQVLVTQGEIPLTSDEIELFTDSKNLLLEFSWLYLCNIV